MEGYEEHYYDVVNLHKEQIQALSIKLDAFKMDYLMKLYQRHVGVKPETIVHQWISSVWEMCQGSGRGYSFSISNIDYSQIKPTEVKAAVSKVHYVGCSCHTWPCHWHVKSSCFKAFKETITPEVIKAFQALGLKINLSCEDTVHTWND
jgi:hypothetical protein